MIRVLIIQHSFGVDPMISNCKKLDENKSKPLILEPGPMRPSQFFSPTLKHCTNCQAVNTHEYKIRYKHMQGDDETQ